MDALANELLKNRLNRYIFLGLLVMIFIFIFFPSLFADLIDQGPRGVYAQVVAGDQIGSEDIEPTQSDSSQIGSEDITDSSPNSDSQIGSETIDSSQTSTDSQLGSEDISPADSQSGPSANNTQVVAGEQTGSEDITSGDSNTRTEVVAGNQLGSEDITPSQPSSQVQVVAGRQLGSEDINPKPVLTSTEHGMCIGSHAWWVREWSNGKIDKIKDWGQQPNECGNTVPQPTNPPAAPVTTTAVSTHTGTSYPQCGGTVGLEGIASNRTVIVTPVLDSNGNVVRYDHDDKGVLAGQCGNPQATTAQAAPVTTTTTQVTSAASCNDDVTYYDPSVGQYIHKHGGRPYNPASAYETSAKDANGCIYAFDQVSAPLVTTCKGQISEDDLESQLHGANYPGPFGLQYQSAEVTAYNNAACPVVTPTPTPTPLVTNVTCPTGTTATTNGNTVVCVSTTPAITSTPTQTPTRQLPETGVPLASVSLAGLVPLGLRLRRFNKTADKSSGQSIWKDREFKSVLK